MEQATEVTELQKQMVESSRLWREGERNEWIGRAVVAVTVVELALLVCWLGWHGRYVNLCAGIILSLFVLVPVAGWFLDWGGDRKHLALAPIVKAYLEQLGSSEAASHRKAQTDGQKTVQTNDLYDDFRHWLERCGSRGLPLSRAEFYPLYAKVMNLHPRSGDDHNPSCLRCGAYGTTKSSRSFCVAYPREIPLATISSPSTHLPTTMAGYIRAICRTGVSADADQPSRACVWVLTRNPGLLRSQPELQALHAIWSAPACAPRLWWKAEMARLKAEDEVCPGCNGRKGDWVESHGSRRYRNACPACGGSGRQTEVVGVDGYWNEFIGKHVGPRTFVHDVGACSVCGGSGYGVGGGFVPTGETSSYWAPCSTCHGTGRAITARLMGFREAIPKFVNEWTAEMNREVSALWDSFGDSGEVVSRAITSLASERRYREAWGVLLLAERRGMQIESSPAVAEVMGFLAEKRVAGHLRAGETRERSG